MHGQKKHPTKITRQNGASTALLQSSPSLHIKK